jgi:hypothetical protein
VCIPAVRHLPTRGACVAACPGNFLYVEWYASGMACNCAAQVPMSTGEMTRFLSAALMYTNESTWTAT